MCVCVSPEAAGKGNPKAGGEDDDLVPSRLDIRVGKIISVEKVGWWIILVDHLHIPQKDLRQEADTDHCWSCHMRVS